MTLDLQIGYGNASAVPDARRREKISFPVKKLEILEEFMSHKNRLLKLAV